MDPDIRKFIDSLGETAAPAVVKRSPPIPGLAARVKESRLAHGWSQEALAKKAGVADSTVWGVEGEKIRGDRSIGRIAKALGVSEKYLRGELSPPKEQPCKTKTVCNPQPQTSEPASSSFGASATLTSP